MNHGNPFSFSAIHAFAYAPDWISRSIPDGLRAQVREVTQENAVLALMGPRSRDVLAAATNDDVSNVVLPYMTGRVIAASAAKRPLRRRLSRSASAVARAT